MTRMPQGPHAMQWLLCMCFFVALGIQIVPGDADTSNAIPPWVAQDALPVPVMNLCATTFHGDLYAIGGETTFSTVLTTVHRLSRDRWVRESTLLTPRAWLGCGARHDRAEDFCVLHMDWIFIPAYCFAIP